MESDAEILLNQATVLRAVEMWGVAANAAIRLAQAERAEKALKDKGDPDASSFTVYS